MTRAGWLGVQLATASEPPARQRRIWGVAFWRRHQPPLSCDLLLNHAPFLQRSRAFNSRGSGLSALLRLESSLVAAMRWLLASWRPCSPSSVPGSMKLTSRPDNRSGSPPATQNREPGGAPLEADAGAAESSAVAQAAMVPLGGSDLAPSQAANQVHKSTATTTAVTEIPTAASFHLTLVLLCSPGSRKS